MSTASTFSHSASTSSASSASSTHTFAKGDKTTATSVWTFNTKDKQKHSTTAQVEHIHQVLEAMKASAAQRTKPPRDWIYDETAEWPLEHVFDAIFTFYPSSTDKKEEDWTQERSANFEYMLDEETGLPTMYSLWYVDVAIVNWETPQKVNMEWKENVFRKSWHSNLWLERRREIRKEEDVGPMGESF